VPFARLVPPALLLGALACAAADVPAGPSPGAEAAGARMALNPGRGKKPAAPSSIAIDPASASLAPGGARQFRAVARSSDGTTSPVAATWSATGGTVTADGLYTAGQAAGAWQVVARSGTLADTAEVTVAGLTTAGRTLVALAVAPGAVTLAPGAAQSFTVAARWSDGATDAPPVTWSATGGTVGAAGAYVAGSATGAFRVVAASGAVADTAEVTIAAAASAEPALFPNAPVTGWTTVADVRWRLPVPFRRDPVYEADNGSHLVNYGDDDPAAEWGRQAWLVADATTPGAPDSTLELRLPAGLTGGYTALKIGQHHDWGGNGPLRWDPAITTGHLYVGLWVRFSPGFSLNGNVAQKLLYVKSDLAANAAINHMVGIMVNDGAGGNQLWPAYEPQHPFNRYRVPAVAANDLNDGRWHQVEFLQAPNTPGVANGTLTIWVDGRLEARWTDAMFFAAGQVPSLNRVEVVPIYGGGSRPVPQNQWIRLGPMVIKTR
jgi:hypothetical protein